jgi:protein-tyrosine phosphatase
LIDLHSHVLPGIDDGVRTLDEALALCAAAAADGVRVLAATPHVRYDYPTTPEQMEAALAELAAAGPAVEVVRGGELALEELDRPDEELARFGLGGTSWLLVETPYIGWPLDLRWTLGKLRERGFRVVLAHPERNADVQARPELLEDIVADGALVQVTAASLDGRLGKSPRRCAQTLLDRDLVHLLASDAHAPEIRSVGLARAASSLRNAALASWLTHAVPEAVLGGEKTPPPRPVIRPRRWFRGR